ncbi:MAG: 16S rRNA (cytidine(1402)-2'-O)-methyltransferase [Firmicutes bacterium]|nr:16S rRNA (cytidine(1402)-2'-O)-methyltransferase [Bacillota bacterium]
MSGTLYLVATPIGNLEDMTYRAVRILGEVDLIAAEDTRVSRRLLNHFEISKPLISYFEHNKRLREDELLQHLLAGEDVALICDAGTPAISDPGADIARSAIEHGINVVPIPGCCAAISALTAAGLDTHQFSFIGFLPREKKDRRAALQAVAAEQRTLVFYEAPHRLKAVLEDMVAAFGEQRRAAACRELTKLHEEFVRGTLAEIREHFAVNEPRGEFVLVIAGAEPPAPTAAPDEAELADMLNELIAGGLPRKAAAKQLAAEYGLSAKDVYAIGLK